MKNNKQKNTILNLQLQKAKKDLNIWLYYANCSTLEEFYEKQKLIEEESFHKADDIMRQVNYIDKIETKIKELNINN